MYHKIGLAIELVGILQGPHRLSTVVDTHFHILIVQNIQSSDSIFFFLAILFNINSIFSIF